MNFESTAERARLMESLRRTVQYMEAAGIPRHVMLDVLSATVRELAAEKPAPGAAARERGKHYETRNSEFVAASFADSKNKLEIANTMEAMAMIGPVIGTVTEKFDPGITLSAFASHLAAMLVEFKGHSKAGALIAQSVLDSLVQTVNTGRSHITEFLIRSEH